MDNKQQLLEYLKSKRMMSLATWGNQVSICTVYYAVDQQCNLYFLSEPIREHSRNIRNDSRVACSIADTRQQVTDKKIGVQIKGTAVRVSRVDQMKWMLVLWSKANPGFESIINLKNIQKKVIQSRVYRITPSEIKFFNEALYGPEGVEVFTF